MPKLRSRSQRPAQVVSRGATKYALDGRAPIYRPIDFGALLCPGCSHKLVTEVKTRRLTCFHCSGRFTVEQVRKSMKGRSQVDAARVEQERRRRHAEHIEELRALADEARQDNAAGIVYYIRFRDAVKIGTTTAPARRLSGLPWDELMAVEPGGRAVEQLRHAEWAEHRLNGEWFEMTDALAEFIESVVVDNIRWIRRSFPRIEALPCPRGRVVFSGGESTPVLDSV